MPRGMSVLAKFFLCLSFCGFKYFYNTSYSSWIWEEDFSAPNQGVSGKTKAFVGLQGDYTWHQSVIAVPAVGGREKSVENWCLSSR